MESKTRVFYKHFMQNSHFLQKLYCRMMLLFVMMLILDHVTLVNRILKWDQVRGSSHYQAPTTEPLSEVFTHQQLRCILRLNLSRTG